MKIYDGFSVLDELIVIICGNCLFYEEWFKINNMMVVFISDKVYYDIGFRVVFIVVKFNGKLNFLLLLYFVVCMLNWWYWYLFLFFIDY